MVSEVEEEEEVEVGIEWLEGALLVVVKQSSVVEPTTGTRGRIEAGTRRKDDEEGERVREGQKS